MEQIEEMLSELQQAGLLDSHGQFSIDFGLALEKIGKQLLPDPRMYVLRFYQSALVPAPKKWLSPVTPRACSVVV